jgi:mannosylglycerate hydrolase
MKTVHIISHTHWDREWYQSFQQFRLRLVHLVDGVLDLLKHDLEFKFFMLDGQTIVLEDYLQMRPEREEELRQYVKRGRIIIGPWHILPDIFLVSPEAHIRNLLQGDRTARRFGDKMMVGYMPDSFGHIGQMPQILRGFNIASASLWRGVDDQPAEFWWQSPDGSRVLMAYLRDSYSNGSSLPAHDLPGFATLLEQQANSLASHSTGDDLLIMYGTDHMEPPLKTAEAITYASEMLRDMKVIHSTLPQFIQALKSSIDEEKLPTIIGELRACSRSPLLPNVLSTRMWIKQRNRASETLIEKWAEPFSTFAELSGNESQVARLQHPSSIIRQTWRMLMENHPHDSICGCSIDQVHDEMKIRFDQVDQVGEDPPSIPAPRSRKLAKQYRQSSFSIPLLPPAPIVSLLMLSFPRIQRPLILSMIAERSSPMKRSVPKMQSMPTCFWIAKGCEKGWRWLMMAASPGLAFKLSPPHAREMS